MPNHSGPITLSPTMQDIRSSSLTPASLAEILRYRDLVKNLIAKDIKVRYQGAALGFAWSLANPMALIALYTFVFAYVFKSAQPNYPLFLISGLLHWNLFSMVVSQSNDFLLGNANLVKKIYFPRILLPTAGVLFNIILWVLAIVILFAIYPFIGGHWSWALLAYPFFLLAFIIFTWGVGLAVSTLNVEYRDLRHIIEVGLMFLFWLTPVVYPYSMIPEHLRPIMAINPLVDFTLIFQSILYSGHFATPRITFAALLWTIASASFGIWLFQRKADHLVEKL